MDGNTVWIILAVLLVACCVLPMMFMGGHGRKNKPNDLGDSANKNINAH